MNVKRLYFILSILFVLQIGWVRGQSYSSSRTTSDDLSQVFRQLRTTLSDIKHELRNHEFEIRTFEKKSQSQETAYDQLRQQLTNDVQSQQDFVRASNVHLEGKIETLDQGLRNLETLFRGVVVDLKQMKTQANDSVTTLSQYKQKIAELEKLLESQNLHMKSLEVALNSMMEVLQVRETSKEGVTRGTEGEKTYKVQSGDNLEKIARAQKVSVQALRDINRLGNNDRIFVGQILKIP